MRVADGIEMLEIASNVMGKSSTINPTLIYDEDTVILVDAGFPGQLSQFREAIEKSGISFDRLSKVIITHQDIDHIGNLSGIISESKNGVEVLAQEIEKPYIQGDKTPVKVAQLEVNLDALPPEMKKIYEMLKAGFKNCITKVNIELKDGEELPYCGGIVILHTPGHTPGHICLYLKQTKTLIAGDMLGIENGLLIPSASRINYDNDLNLKSLDKLTKYDIQNVICYHGGLYDDNVNKRIAELAKQ